MTSLSSRTRKALTLVLSTAVLAGALGASVQSASAWPIFPPLKPWGWGYGPGYGAALAGGMALGAIAAASSANAAGGDCYLVRRRVVDTYGNEYMRRVRVCD